MEGESSDCEVEGCDRIASLNRAGKFVCQGHYSRHQNKGEFGSPTIRTQRKSRSKCILPECDAEDCGLHGLCKMHYSRNRRNGDPRKATPHSERMRGAESYKWTGDDATYTAVHQRLRGQRGPAKCLQCVDCGCVAKQWSYSRGGGEYERQSEYGPYSTRLEDYEPRCVSCHKLHDLAAIRKAGGAE